MYEHFIFFFLNYILHFHMSSLTIFDIKEYIYVNNLMYTNDSNINGQIICIILMWFKKIEIYWIFKHKTAHSK